MAMRIGTLRGLDACASATGAFSVLALDHRNNLRRLLRPDDPEAVTRAEMVEVKSAIVRTLAPYASGVLLDPEVGAAPAVFDGAIGRTGLIVALEASGYDGPATARRSRLLPGWSVRQAKRMGADAVKLLLYYHPDAENAETQERLLMEVAENCLDADLPLFLETLAFAIDAPESELTGESRRDIVVRTARRLTALGGDVLKCEFPYDASVTDRERWRDACAELDDASAIPWVILSAGVDDATFEAQAEAACTAGASGVMVGRSVWQESVNMAPAERDAWLASDGSARLQRLAAIVDAGARPWRRRSPLLEQPGPDESWYEGYPE